MARWAAVGATLSLLVGVSTAAKCVELNEVTERGPGGCAECSSDAKRCLKCVEGFGWVMKKDGTCKECTPWCTDCLNETKCKVCAPGHRRTFNGTCEACTDVNCEVCSWTRGVCEKCYGSFGLVKNPRTGKPTCRQCTDLACRVCNNAAGPSTSRCQECIDRPLLANGTCASCRDPFCTKCPRAVGWCIECASGYVAVGGKCLACKAADCQRCPPSNPKRCTACYSYAGGVDLATGGCKPCKLAACIECSTNSASCGVCESGYNRIRQGGVYICKKP